MGDNRGDWMVFKCDARLALLLWSQWHTGELDADLHLGRVENNTEEVVVYIRAISPGAVNEWLRINADIA